MNGAGSRWPLKSRRAAPPAALGIHRTRRSACAGDGGTRRNPTLGRSPCAAALAACLVALGLAGCVRQQPSEERAGGGVGPPDAQLTEALFDSAMGSLERLDEVDSPAVLRQVTERLSQWIDMQQRDSAWQPDPLIGTLPEVYRKLPVLAAGRLRSPHFTYDDGIHLNEAVWFRAVSKANCGDSADELARAARLFDWTVRNVQLDRPEVVSPGRFPFQTLLQGHGSVDDRSEAFILLCRQQGIEVVLLVVPDRQDQQRNRPWLTAALIGQELYLFDLELGLPIPGPDGQGVATLRQAVEDPQILARLDLDDDHPYRVQASDLTRVGARISASPGYLSQRMAEVEAQLTGDQRLVVSIAPSAIAKRLQACPQVGNVRLWTWPYATIVQRATDEARAALRAEIDRLRIDRLPEKPPLFRMASVALQRGRVMHLRGAYTGEEGANRLYPLARPSEDEITRGKLDREQTEIVVRNKQDASYWLGLAAFERGHYESAIDHLEKRTLEASPGGPWSDAARYNLARTYEASGQLDKAVALLRADSSPQQHGNRLRARWLESQGTRPTP